MGTIFYSWQSDLPDRCNRSLIENALDGAAKRLRQDPDVLAAARGGVELDRDTKGVPGSPEIAEAIFSKIEAADACVFDVSIVFRGERSCPNPNVLIELGFALKCLGSARTLLVFNTAFGQVGELPFDIRSKRVLEYCAPDTEGQLAALRSGLAWALHRGLEQVYLHLEEHRFSNEEQEFYQRLYQSARIYLDSVTEGLYRSDPDSFRSSCSYTARSLRELLAFDVAVEEETLAAEVSELARALDELAAWTPRIAEGGKFKAAVEKEVPVAERLLDPCLPALKFRYRHYDPQTDVRKEIRRAVQEYDRFVERLEATDMLSLRRVRQSMANIGNSLLKLGIPLVIKEDPLADTIRHVGYSLRSAQHRGTEESGFRPEAALCERLAPVIDQLRALV